VLASCEADEARLVENIEVAPVGTMRSAVRVLSGGRCDRPGRVAGESARRRDATARDAVATGVDLCEGAGSITPSKPPSSPRLARTMCC